MNKKVLVAMSGGVDSSVTLYLMKNLGYECLGITMKLIANDDIGLASTDTCCSFEDTEDARAVAFSLGAPHYVFNFIDTFKEEVISRFVEAYQNGETPNPCIDCNRYIKFEKLFLRMRQLDFDYIATGHYARIDYDVKNDRYLLKKALDISKDQSYVLYSMTQKQLKHTFFPLGNYTKEKTRELAKQHGLVNASKKDSQDICFVKDRSYGKFIEEYTNQVSKKGNFIDMDGNILGEHKGLIYYTKGQRKGLGIAYKHPLYVHSKNMDNNTIKLCGIDGLFSKSLDAKDFNWISFEKITHPIRVKAKTGYKHKEQWATVSPNSDGFVHIEFDIPQRAITEGQAVVLYDDDIVVGGGTIIGG